ncbi:aspartic peptidase domain-containing protein [Lanmaoa asiatica]|nr:aspartic peptidase domain-containing protein [Lanmaoa asiatica]
MLSSTDDRGFTHVAWATLPMNVAPYLSEGAYIPSTVPALVGTPPQQVNLTVGVASGLLATYASDCILCAGTTMFDPSLSSTFKTNGNSWDSSVPSFSGVEVSDTVGFGGLSFTFEYSYDLRPSTVNILDGSNITYANSIWNGHLGLFLNPLNTTAIARHLLTHLHESSSLLNPVVGMRFDPANPKLTIGALDPNDYEGTINWVQLNQTPNPKDDYFNTFNFDGVKGYDGRFVPYMGILNAALDSFSLSISLPNADTYFNNTNSTGPVPQAVGLIPDIGVVEYNCTSDSYTLTSSSGLPQSPYVAVDGDDQRGRLSDRFHRQPVKTSIWGILYWPSVVLGLPFLRSVYMYVTFQLHFYSHTDLMDHHGPSAYRFPTDDCPGYYGFAFPSGSNRTQSQISQTPTATPTNSARMLVFAAPTSTPTASVVLAQEALASKGTYAVYGRQGANQVPLMGVDNIPKMVWNWTSATSG